MGRLKQAIVLAALIVGTYLVLPVAAQTFTWTLVNGLPFGPGFTITGPGKFPNGTASAPSIAFASATNRGFYVPGSDQLGYSNGGSLKLVLDNTGNFEVRHGSGGIFCWSSNADPSAATCDTSLTRGAANRVDLPSGDSLNLVLGNIGHGVQSATVDGATTFALTSNYVLLACTGAEQINTITGGLVGTVLTIEHTDTECTLDDDDATTAADAIDLVGTNTDDVGAVNKTITLLRVSAGYWLQVAESDN